MVARYYREPAIVLISQVDDDTYLVVDGQTEYYIDRETFEKEYKEL